MPNWICQQSLSRLRFAGDCEKRKNGIKIMFAIFESAGWEPAHLCFCPGHSHENTGEMEFSKEANDFVSLVRILLTSIPV